MCCDIVLASASPRRRELLDQIGIRSHALPVDIDESVLDGETPAQTVQRLAVAKARRAGQRVDGRWRYLPVLGADTVIELDGVLLGKPADAAHARRMLTRLSATTHVVHTAIALLCGERLLQALCSSRVTFGELDAAQIRRYVDSGEPLDKAGGYGIQGSAAAFIRRLEGSYSAVMGLPLYETAQLLAQCGVAVQHQPLQSETA